MWYVYFLRLKNGDVYVGSTNDLRQRFNLHQSGRVMSTRSLIPAELLSYVAVDNETTARRLERYFKSGSGKAFAKKRFFGAAAPDEMALLAEGELSTVAEMGKVSTD